MSDESRPFKGPYKIRYYCAEENGERFEGPILYDALGEIVDLDTPERIEQLRLALELLERLPRIEAALDFESDGNALEQLELCKMVRAELAALKEPRP